MTKKSVTPQDVCALLNEMLLRDYDCTKALVEQRISCNRALANHPTVMVRAQRKKNTVGLLGVLNGLFGVREQDNMGLICARYANDGTLLLFEPTPIQGTR